MLLYYSIKKLFVYTILSLIFFSCTSSQEYRFDKLWKFLTADKSNRVVAYYIFKNDNQLEIRLDNLSQKGLRVDFRLRIYESRDKLKFFETPLQSIFLPIKQERNEHQYSVIDLPDFRSVQSIEVEEFIVSESSD